MGISGEKKEESLYCEGSVSYTVQASGSSTWNKTIRIKNVFIFKMYSSKFIFPNVTQTRLKNASDRDYLKAACGNLIKVSPSTTVVGQQLSSVAQRNQITGTGFTQRC